MLFWLSRFRVLSVGFRDLGPNLVSLLCSNALLG